MNASYPQEVCGFVEYYDLTVQRRSVPFKLLERTVWDKRQNQRVRNNVGTSLKAS